MNPPPYIDRHGEHWIGSYDTDEEDAIREAAAVDKPVESVDDGTRE